MEAEKMYSLASSPGVMTSAVLPSSGHSEAVA